MVWRAREVAGGKLGRGFRRGPPSGRSGTLLVFVPAESFKVEQGEEVLTDYQFNRNIIHHLFCSTCGIKSFARGVGKVGKPTAAINVRCLEGVDVSTIPIMQFDGKSR